MHVLRSCGEQPPISAEVNEKQKRKAEKKKRREEELCVGRLDHSCLCGTGSLVLASFLTASLWVGRQGQVFEDEASSQVPGCRGVGHFGPSNDD
jgi:hypothetical protein